MEDITYTEKSLYAKKFVKNLKKKDLGDYRDLYLKSDTLVLCDLCKNFRKMYLKTYHLDPV